MSPTPSWGPRLFQFTPLREGRRLCSLDIPPDGLFQFTPLREGRQGSGPGRPAAALISIHAPARGATAKLNKICSVFSAIIEKNS